MCFFPWCPWGIGSCIIEVFKTLTEWQSVCMLVCAYWNHLQMSDGVHQRVSALEILLLQHKEQTEKSPCAHSVVVCKNAL